MKKYDQISKDIMNATELLIQKEGYLSVTMQKIATLSEVSRRTVYRHYPTMDQIVLDLINKYFDNYNNRIESSLKGFQSDGFTSIKNFFDIFYSVVIESHELFIYLGIFTEHGRTSSINTESFKTFAKKTRVVHKFLEIYIEKGLMDKTVKCTSDPAIVAVVLIDSLISSAIDIHRNIKRDSVNKRDAFDKKYNVWDIYKILVNQMIESFRI